MASQEEFAAFLRSERQQHELGYEGRDRDEIGDWANANANTNAWTAQTLLQQRSPRSRQSRPPHVPKVGEHFFPTSRRSENLPVYRIESSMIASDHVRSFSDNKFEVMPHSDPTHPFNKVIAPVPSPTAGGTRRMTLPPRSATPPRQPASSSLIGSITRLKTSHRRSMSESRVMDSSGSVGSGSGRLISKADLLKKLPSPRWSGAPLKSISYNRSRSGSDGPLLSIECRSDRHVGGYGAIAPDSRSSSMLQPIESIEFSTNPSSRHQRNRSDASVISYTTDMAKSSLFKGVTDTGRIQLQLPKDGFRILMDSQLESGYVYKRKLIENEDDLFVEFHAVDEEDPVNMYGGCYKCREKTRRLPPDLYVMAVDSTIYRRMLDEVIASRAMPCGTFFCGHHADVRQPDITIAALVVGAVFLLLLAGSIIIKD